MRKSMSILLIGAVATAAMTTPLSAQTAPVPARAVPGDEVHAMASLINAYPNGGPEMAAEVAARIIRDPNAATALVNYLKSSPRLNQQQRKAVQQGLSEALDRLKATNQVDPNDPSYRLPAIIAMAAFALLGLVILIDDDDDDDVQRAQKSMSPN
jgi:hypothetical protein